MTLTLTSKVLCLYLVLFILCKEPSKDIEPLTLTKKVLCLYLVLYLVLFILCKEVGAAAVKVDGNDDASRELADLKNEIKAVERRISLLQKEKNDVDARNEEILNLISERLKELNDAALYNGQLKKCNLH